MTGGFYWKTVESWEECNDMDQIYVNKTKFLRNQMENQPVIIRKVDGTKTTYSKEFENIKLALNYIEETHPEYKRVTCSQLYAQSVFDLTKNGHKRMAYGHTWEFKKNEHESAQENVTIRRTNACSVLEYDKFTGHLIKVYASRKDAMSHLGVGHHVLADYCLGEIEHPTSIFKYGGEKNPPIKQKAWYVQYDMDGYFIQKFPRVKSAASSITIDNRKTTSSRAAAIAACYANPPRQKSAFGFQWRKFGLNETIPKNISHNKKKENFKIKSLIIIYCNMFHKKKCVNIIAFFFLQKVKFFITKYHLLSLVDFF